MWYLTTIAFPTQSKSHSKSWSKGQRLCKGIFQHPAAKFGFGLSGLGFFIYKLVGLNWFFNKFILSKLNFLFESLRIQKMTPLINAAKKHHTEVRYCLKNIAVTKHDKNINTPKRCVLLILETKRGVIEAIK